MSRDLLASTDDALFEPPRALRPAAIRRLGLVAFAVAYRLVAALLIAGPFAVLLSGAVAGDPRGDAVLFDPGALMLLEAVRLSARGAAVAGSASGVIALLTTFLGLLPFAALIAGLGRQGRLSLAYLAARAVQPIGTLALLWGVGLMAQVVFAGGIGLLGVKAVERLHLATPGDDLGGVVVVALALLVVLAVGVVRDIAAVAAVNDGSRFYTSTARALQIMRRAGRRAFWAYAWRGLLAIAAIVAAWVVVSALGRSVPPRAGISFLVHQAAIVVTVFLHASWLAVAIRLLDQDAPRAQADVVDTATATATTTTTETATAELPPASSPRASTPPEGGAG